MVLSTSKSSIKMSSGAGTIIYFQNPKSVTPFLDTPPPGTLRRLIIKMQSTISNSHKYVSCACKLRIQDQFGAKVFLVETDALIHIRSKYMNVVNVVCHPAPSPFVFPTSLLLSDEILGLTLTLPSNLSAHRAFQFT